MEEVLLHRQRLEPRSSGMESTSRGLWKPSRYNFLVETDGRAYLFNAVRGSLLKVEDNNRKRVSNLLECDWIVSDAELKLGIGREAAIILKRGGFIIRSDFDELEYIRLRNDVSRFSARGLSLAVCPTMACNLRCTYCYQSGRRGHWEGRVMSERTTKSLIAFVGLSARSIRQVGIVWYGGEPTLAMGIISMITRCLKEICEGAGVSYSASMITNGYNLEGELARALLDLGISSVQVTLDGPREIHDKRRYHVSGTGTFDRIVENITKLAPRLPISIRINLDKENLESIPSLLEYLASLGLNRSNVRISIARVLSSAEICASGTDRCLRYDEFSRHELGLQRIAWNLGFRVPPPLRLALSACGACGVNCYAVDPEGWLYNCWEEVGKRELACGHIDRSGEMRVDIPNTVRWTSIDPTRSEHCSKCKYLPLCMGGCLYRYLFDKRCRFQCPEVRFHLDERMKLYVDLLRGRVRTRAKERR